MTIAVAWVAAALPFGLLFWLMKLGNDDVFSSGSNADEVSTWLAEKRWRVRRTYGPPPRIDRPEVHWPEVVTRLAEAAASGVDCDFALHDALLEAGHPDLAACFRTSRNPASCWAIGHILGKS
ncbi:MAG: hypothetical protein K2R98_21290 [Gemmataceae bacterium]|nr:hypothetical protein [Gemmataceae bacterium]